MTDLSSLFPQGVGNITTDNDITDNALIRGDGGAKKAQECSTITVTDDGEMTNTGQPCFSVKPTSNQSNIATGGVTVVLDTEIFDIGNNFASNTFTAPVTGKYQLNAHVRLGDVDVGAADIQLELITSNRTYYATIDPNFSEDLTHYALSISMIVDMDANDTAYLQINQTGGTAQLDIRIFSFFSGALIC